MIEGKKIRLRFPKNEEEIHSLYKTYNNLAERAITDHSELISREGWLKRYKENQGWSSPSGSLVIADKNNVPIGTISSSKKNDFEIEIGYRILAADSRGKGYMTEALTLFSSYLFDCTPHITRLSLVTSEDNTPSRKLVEKCGYKQEGILRKAYFYRGKVVNWVLYSLLREEAAPFK